jgi:hypothetical protein
MFTARYGPALYSMSPHCLSILRTLYLSNPLSALNNNNLISLTEPPPPPTTQPFFLFVSLFTTINLSRQLCNPRNVSYHQHTFTLNLYLKNPNSLRGMDLVTSVYIKIREIVWFAGAAKRIAFCSSWFIHISFELSYFYY